MKKIKIITIILSLFILSLTFITARSPLRAQGKADVDKLDQILQQQNDILQKLDLIKEEVTIIKYNTNRC